MRKFSSYGPINTKLHYYAPRKALIDKAYTELTGENPEEGGHYITVWAPRQSGKTWVMQQVMFHLKTGKNHEKFDVVKINLQHLKSENDVSEIIRSVSEKLLKQLNKDTDKPDTLKDFEKLFSNEVLDKPLILILDEFDALPGAAISNLADIFRNIYITRQDQADKPSEEKTYLLHGVALIGVRSVLGIENVTGSPFNIQRSLHIPNLTFAETKEMFKWYETESGHKTDQDVIEKLYYETRGQPGLTCWFGELLTQGFENYTPEKNRPMSADDFDEVYAAATDVLPNNNILNIISKAKEKTSREFVLEMFRTDEKISFKYDDRMINYLYMNGVIDVQKVGKTENYVRFSCPFVQKRLFNYFSNELFSFMGKLTDPFENLDHAVTDETLNIKNIIGLYRDYLVKNREWLLKDAPRRKDLRIFEAVYHFNLFMYLFRLLKSFDGRVWPEFPTGNGEIDIIIKYSNKIYGLELKSYTNEREYKKSLLQAARYGKNLGLAEIYLIFFVEYIDEDNRKKYEAVYSDNETRVRVIPVFVETGN